MCGTRRSLFKPASAATAKPQGRTAQWPRVKDPVGTYWRAVGKADGEAMARCYAADATFRDPVFRLADGEVRDMWRMLLPPGNEVAMTTGPLERRDGGATGALEAVYRFPSTGRRVHNHITSTFTVREGLIVDQRDRFSFWRWSRMALGPVGWGLGWTPLLRRQVRRQARRRLDKWQSMSP